MQVNGISAISVAKSASRNNLMDGVSLSWRLLTELLIGQHQLGERAICRSEQAEREYCFLYNHQCPQLPVWVGSELRILCWGCPGKGSRLPKTRSVRREVVDAGLWASLNPELVTIPANFVIDRGTWYRIREGIQAIVVRNESGVLIVYPLTEPASHYYQVMTRQERMPVLKEEKI